MATFEELQVVISASVGDFEVKIAQIDKGLGGVGNAAAAASNRATGALGSIAGAVSSAAGSINDKLVAAFKAADDSGKKLQDGIGRLGEGLKSVGQNLTIGVSAPLAALGVLSLKAAGDIQALEKGFAATYNGSEELSVGLAKVRELAKLPGLGLKEALQGATNLQAAGFSADLATRALGAFGNALATVGKGKADLDGVGLALGQIASKGKISAEEINQLAERVPQIRKAMQAAFGTSDTEQLNKLGISATAFVEGVTKELEKLPQVTGGINNAFENAADSVTLALSAIGTSLNKNFNIEGVLGVAGDAIAGLVQSFQNLSPETQKVIFVVGGLAAAVGPLLLGLGALGAAIPALVTGLGTIGAAVGLAAGPVALLVAGVAAAAAAIILNWDSIVSYFSNGVGGRVFSDLSASVSQALAAIRSAFEGISRLGGDSFGGLISASGVLSSVVRSVGDGVTGILKTISGFIGGITALINGDLSGALAGAKTLLDGLTTPVRSLLGLLEKKPDTNGFSNYFTSLNTGITGLRGLVGEVTMTNAALSSTGEVVKPVVVSLDSLKNKLKELQEAFGRQQVGTVPFYDTKKQIADLEALIKKYEDTGKAGEKAREALTKIAEALRVNDDLSRTLGNSYDFIGGRQQALESGVKSLISAGFSPASSAVQKLVGELKLLNDIIAGSKLDKIATIDPLQKPKTVKDDLGNERQVNPFTGIRKDLEETLPEVDGLMAKFRLALSRPFDPLPGLDTGLLEASVLQVEDITSRVPNAITGLSNATVSRMAEFNTNMDTLLEDLNSSVGPLLADFAVQFGDAFGSIISGTASAGSAFQTLFSGILQSLAGFMGQFGQQLITIGIGKLALDTLFKGPAGGPLAIAAGIGLVALAGIAKNLAKNSASSIGKIGSGGGGGSLPAIGGSSSSTSTRPQVSQSAPAPVTVTHEVIMRAKGADLDGVLRIEQGRRQRIYGG